MKFIIIKILFINFIEKPAESQPMFGNNQAFGSVGAIKTPITNLFGGNTNGNNENASKDTPITGFSFKLPPSTTVTPITAIDSPSTQTPNQTSTPITEVPKTNEQKSASSIFGGAGGMSFADLAQTTPTTNPSESFKSSNNFSFATLAQNSTNGSSTPAFSSAPSTDGGFFGLSNRDTFSNLMQPTVNGNGPNATTGDDHSENHSEDANYDPHYEPIIALPDEIKVSTGEENEEKIFGERAKLYRFDSENKEVKISLFE